MIPKGGTVGSELSPVGRDRALLIPAVLVDRWNQQIATDYDALPEAEKESDRQQARRYIQLPRTAFGDLAASR